MDKCSIREEEFARMAAHAHGMFLIGSTLHAVSDTSMIGRAKEHLGHRGLGDLIISIFERRWDQDTELQEQLKMAEAGGRLEGSLLDGVARIAADSIEEAVRLGITGGRA